jgi:hypothetical protein
MGATETIAVPERLFRADVADAPFAAGVDRGWWRMRSIEWPHAIIEIAVPPRPNVRRWLALRFALSAYPHAPSAQPWDVAANAPLAEPCWPSGNESIMRTFNPAWRSDALYLPMDRLALEGHDAWLTQHACHVWDPAKDITQYLRLIHELLDQEGYTGARG